MFFRTPVKTAKSSIDITHNANSMLIGSCFAENMAERLDHHLFPISLNPFGILYNAFSISKGLHYIAGTQTISEKDLIFDKSLWHSKWHHGRFSSVSKEEILEKTNFALDVARKKLTNTNTLIITLGTAYVYTLKSSGEIISNCHKIPASQFKRSRLGINEIYNHLSEAIKKILALKPAIKIIFTVSPIRHLKDGLVENQRSKAILLLACEKLVEAFDNAHYFPSYEILMDELRDYRFYAKDMLHPNETSSAYIWSKFQEAFFSEETKGLVQEIGQLKKEINHRPFHPESEAHLAFKEKLANKIEVFEKKYTGLKFS